jgi:tetratricopeptide (TPR) repeat protein
MPKSPLIVALITALLIFAASATSHAQSQSDNSQSIPDAPQPQKKPPTKPQSSDPGSQPTDKTNANPQASDSSSPDNPTPPPKTTKDDNPFPEDVSKQAAKATSGSSDHPADPDTGKPKPSTKDDNPFPEDISKQAAKAASGTSDHPSDPDTGKPKPSTKDDNPFPEDVSKQAAKAAGNDPAPTAKPDVPPGFSSSQSNPDNGSDQLVDPPRAKKDAEVGGFYLKNGDYQGALLRYKDATNSDPTNVEAIFGLAETQRMLKKNAEAARNYQLYLDIVPNGPRAKQALKALKSLGSGG